MSEFIAAHIYFELLLFSRLKGIEMLKKIILSGFIVSFCTPAMFADHGFDRIIINNTGRCWRTINRDFDDKTRLKSAVSFRFVTVGGTGQTDDPITYELTFKEDFQEGVGWDETKTRTYTGGGLIKSIDNGRVNFEFYVDLGDGNPAITVDAFYHPGPSTADSDDNLVLGIPVTLQALADLCAVAMGEGGGL